MPMNDDDERIRVLKERAANTDPQNGLLDFLSGHMVRPRQIGLSALRDTLKQAYPGMVIVQKSQEEK